MAPYDAKPDALLKWRVLETLAWTSLSESDLFRHTMSKELHDIAVPFQALNHGSSMRDNCDCLHAL